MLTFLQIQELRNAVQKSPFSHIYKEQLWWQNPEQLSVKEYEAILSQCKQDEQFIIDSAIQLSEKSKGASMEVYAVGKSAEHSILESREKEDSSGKDKDLDSLLNSL